MISWQYFETAAPETLENFQENICSSHLMKWTAYYWTKTLVTDISLEVLRRKRMFLNFENSKKLFQNCFFFCNATGMQSRISGFNKTDYTKKSFLLVFWNSSKYLRKDLQWSHFIKVTRLLFKSLTVIKNH